MTFSSLVGQTMIKERLGNALTGIPGHAYVFTGPAGIGKKTMARAFAQALLCEQPSRDGACHACTSCRHFEHQVHPDFRQIFLEEKEKNIKVERVRQSVSADLVLQPQFSRRKIYLIDADSLNEQGQNALLKSLEEPPGYVVFLLLATGPERLLPTILSRVSILPLKRYNTSEIVAILQQNGAGTPDTIDFYARYANGLPGLALDLAHSSWFSDLRQETIRFYLSIANRSRADLLTDGYQFFDNNRPHTATMIDMMTSLIRDQLISIVSPDRSLLTNQDESRALLAAIPRSSDPQIALQNCSAALLAARRGLALNASYEGLICQLLLTLRKELKNA